MFVRTDLIFMDTILDKLLPLNDDLRRRWYIPALK